MPEEIQIKLKDGQNAYIDTSKPLDMKQYMWLQQKAEPQDLANKMQLFSQKMRSAETSGGGKLPHETIDPMAKRLMMGGLGAGFGFADGGLIGSAVGGTSGLLAPGETDGEVIGNMVGMLPGLGKIDRMAQAMPWLGKIMTRAGLGAGMFEAGDLTRQAIDQPGTLPELNPLGAGFAAGLGIAGGSIGEKANASPGAIERRGRVNVQDAVDNLFGQPTPLNSLSYEGGAKEAAPIFGFRQNAAVTQAKELADLKAERDWKASRARSALIAQRQSQAAIKQATLDVDPEVQKLDAIKIDRQKKVNDLNADERAIKKFNLDPRTGKVYDKSIPKPPVDYAKILDETLGTVAKETGQFGGQQRPLGGLADVYRAMFKDLTDAGAAPIEAATIIATKGKEFMPNNMSTVVLNRMKRATLENEVNYRKAIDEQKQKQLLQIEKDRNKAITEIKYNELQRLGRISGKILPAATNPTINTSQQGLASLKAQALQLGVDLDKRRADFQTLRDAVTAKKQEKLFVDPAVSKVLGGSGATASSPEEIAKNILNMDSTDFAPLYKELNDPALQKNVQNTYLLELLRDSYVPDKNLLDFEAMAKKTSGSKLTELFGGGPFGAAKAQGFQDFMAGVQKLQMAAKQNEELRKSGYLGAAKWEIGGLLGVIGTGLVYHNPTLQKAIAAGTLLHLPFNERLINRVAADPRVGNQFLKWAESGGTTTALKAYPLVDALFKDEAKEIE